MQLVILAAGHGRRFGGLKQLAPVGPSGEAIMDYTAANALACGFRSITLIVRDEIAAPIASHIEAVWPSELDVKIICQPPIPGTAQAVLAAKGAVSGAFGVANADDLYGCDALGALASFLDAASDTPGEIDAHLLVTYRLMQTVLTDAPVTRGLCNVAGDGSLASIVEHEVTLREDGCFDASPLGRAEDKQLLFGSEPVSMNLWGFGPRMLDALEASVTAFVDAPGAKRELLLPEVVEELIRSGRNRVDVVGTTDRCIGLTHPSDIALVRDEVALAPEPRSTVRAAHQN